MLEGNFGEALTPAAPYRREFSKHRRRATVAAVVLLALLGVLAILLDWREVRGVISQATWKPVFASLGITAVSYLTQGYSFALLNRLFGIGLTLPVLFRVGLVSSAMIAALGGVAGHSLRLLLLTRRGVAAGDVMAPSLFHGYMESLIFFALIPAGLGYLALTPPLSPGLSLAVTTWAAVLGLAFKHGTDDLREAPGMIIARELLRRGASLTLFDPLVDRLKLPSALGGNVHVASTVSQALDGAEAVFPTTGAP